LKSGVEWGKEWYFVGESGAKWSKMNLQFHHGKGGEPDVHG